MHHPNDHVITLDTTRTPVLAESAWIAPGAIVVGRVTLHENVSVWYHAVLRADSSAIEIGERSNVQDGVVIHVDKDHPARIGARVSVGHNAVIHGATIGNDTLIGMNSTILSGAVVGAHCLVAAGAVVTQDQIVPEGCLVAGVPAKVVRELSTFERSNLHSNSDTYLQHTVDHRAAVCNKSPEMY